MLLVSDVHGAFDSLGRVASSGEPLLVLGDLVNLVDYRTIEGIIPDVVGRDIVAGIVDARERGDYEGAARLWDEGSTRSETDVRAEIGHRMRREYERMAEALAGASAYVIHGNVDDPRMLEAHLPDGVEYVDEQVREIGGYSVGFIGGGVPRIGSRGELTDDAMREKLERLGTGIDVLCTHVAPDVPMLAQDVIGGSTKGSEPVREYLERAKPRYHYFGDVHQPRATAWQHGPTECINVGYFRATGRAHRHAPG